MPRAFNKCVAGGGKVRTKELGKGKYMRICFLNGKSYAGEVKVKKDNKFAKALSSEGNNEDHWSQHEG